MPRFTFFLVPGLACLLTIGVCSAVEKPAAAKAEPAAQSVEQIAATARKSVVVITFAGRDGKQQGLGTGFVVDADGLIATNLHVLGQARQITVETADGKQHEVTSIHASDRSLDLALVRINVKGLTPLPVGDSDRLKEGQPVVAIGNPHGLKNSVVSGVVSAKRELEGRAMIQLAIPIEPGNSGGPLLDLQGRVQGILTMKSLLTPNLGFAIPINRLKPLLKKPNPIPMARWLTIGTLDPAEWTTLLDGRWRQRAGKILAEGMGSGFGGRTVCLAKQPPPDIPYELAVTVRLDDEAGAAGLIFHADGGDKHYGFYPSGGQLRLTRFEGPDVYSWTILAQRPSPHYRPGDWNTLKVRVEKDRILCYVNNHLVVESNDIALQAGRVGLAKFRNTRAEFKHFQVARQLAEPTPPADLVKRINQSVDKLAGAASPGAELVDGLLPNAAASMSVLRDRAKHLEEQAAQMRQLAQAVHQKQVQGELLKVLRGKEDDIDLFHAALLIARLDNEELEVDGYRREIERMARDLKRALGKEADDKAKLAALNKYLFIDHGFHGSRSDHDYYNKANSYLNEVLDDREGLPITLSIIYMELARRLGLKVVGIGMPGHFVVKYIPVKGEGQLLDVFDDARPLPEKEARQRIEESTERPARDVDFAVVDKKAILIRILHNLLSVAHDERDVQSALRYLDTILAMAPDSVQDHVLRAVARRRAGDRKGALEDVDWALDHKPDDINLERIEEFRRELLRQGP
ncbi:MAG TPA: tetratricopeptide repeat protein [Gemmataceae bacterium]|nr:tetratricopeptide repeat protein [Gemmataceae bacterium]